MCSSSAFTATTLEDKDPLSKEMRKKIRDEDLQVSSRKANLRNSLDLLPPDPNPFAVFGPRIGVDRVSGVKAGRQGRSTSVSDLKIGR